MVSKACPPVPNLFPIVLEMERDRDIGVPLQSVTYCKGMANTITFTQIVILLKGSILIFIVFINNLLLLSYFPLRTVVPKLHPGPTPRVLIQYIWDGDLDLHF